MAKRKTLHDYAKERLAELGMDEPAATALLAKTPAQRTKELIAMFASRQAEVEKTDILDLLAYTGEVKRTGDFFSDILEGEDEWLKFTVAMHAWMLKKYQKHRRLAHILETHLKGVHPVDVWVRNRFPNGVPRGAICSPRTSSIKAEKKESDQTEE